MLAAVFAELALVLITVGTRRNDLDGRGHLGEENHAVLIDPKPLKLRVSSTQDSLQFGLILAGKRSH